LGSIGELLDEWSYPDVSTVIANENYKRKWKFRISSL